MQKHIDEDPYFGAYVTPTKERHRQNGGLRKKIIFDKDKRDFVNRYRAVWECPLDMYRDHKIISEKQYQAGMRFRKIYYSAVLSHRPDYRPITEEQANMGASMSEIMLNKAYEIMDKDEAEIIVDILFTNGIQLHMRSYAKGWAA